MVDRLVVARHADYDSDGITESGANETRSLAHNILAFMTGELTFEEDWFQNWEGEGINYLEPGMTVVLSSTAQRAKETAAIIADVLGLGMSYSFDRLGDEEGVEYKGNFIAAQLENIIHPQGGYEGLVVVTHQNQTGYLPQHIHPLVRQDLGSVPYSSANAIDELGNVITIFSDEVFPPGPRGRKSK